MAATGAGIAPRKGWVQVMPSVGDLKLKTATMEEGEGPPLSQKVQPPVPPPRPNRVPKPPPRKQTRGPEISSPQMEANYDPTLHKDALASHYREDRLNIPARDFFFDSDKVLSLISANFTTVLTRKDVTLVMFYSGKNPESCEFQKTFSEAASCTQRENHAFAGVDCDANPRLCQINGVGKLPSVKLYSKTYCVGEMKCVNTLSAELLRQYVEMAPVSDESRMVECQGVNK